MFDIVEYPLLTGINLNDDLSSIFLWAIQWFVDFNAIKQETFIISKKRIKAPHPPLYMGWEILLYHKLTRILHKHLGIIFSNDMSWNNHINTIVDKAYKGLCILRKHKFYLDRCSLDKIYKLFIRPLLEKGNNIWDNSLQESEKALENIQLDAARIATAATKVCSVQKLYN